MQKNEGCDTIITRRSLHNNFLLFRRSVYTIDGADVQRIEALTC